MGGIFKTRLKSHETLIGTLLTLGTPAVAEIMAKVGFDWLWIDMEHAPTDLATVQTMIQAAGEYPCLVRVPWNDEVWIKRVLDLGCSGVVIPQIRTGSEARSAIAACKYPPVGTRSVGIARAQGYGINVQDYLAQANEQIAVVLQIEHIQAVRNLSEILDTPDIDAIMIGPFDLSASMGLIGQVTHPQVQEAIQQIKSECIARQIPVGIFTTDAKGAKTQIASGCTLIALGIDTIYLWRAAKETLNTLSSSDTD